MAIKSGLTTDIVMDFLKKNIGIPLCILFVVVFDIIAYALGPHFYGTGWYLVSSLQRFLFFALELFIFMKLFKKLKASEVIHMKGFKQGLIAGIAMLLYVPFDFITYCVIGPEGWNTVTVPMIIACLVFQQLTTGLWEELTFRVYVCEGYYQSENKTARRRITYAMISFLIFGMLHAVECDSLEVAIYRFLSTGIWGFAFAAVYLYTHNFIVTAFLHFITDIFLNIPNFVTGFNDSVALTIMDNYVLWVIKAVILVVAVIFLIRKPIEEKEMLNNES